MSFWDWLIPSKPRPAVVTAPVPAAPPALLAPAVAPSDALLAFTATQEGFQAVAYWDVDSYAIGYGSHFIDGQPVVKGQTITQAAALQALRLTTTTAAQSILATVSVPLTQGQLDALVDFVYNVGIGSLQRSTLLKTINSKATVTEAMFTVWSKAQDATGNLVTSAGLLARRTGEYQQFWSV